MRHMCLLLLGLLSLEGVHGKCPVGFESMRGSCIDTNECEEVPSLCGNDTKCFNTEGTYYCLCNEGYETNKKRVNFTQETGETCRDKNECQEDRGVCGPNSECRNTIGSFDCTCSPGFVSSSGSEMFKANQGINCTDRDECEYEKCGEHAKCINFPGNYSCVCDPGFRQTLGKMHFYENEGPCEDVDECQQNSDICGPNAECINTIGSYNCSCRAGFVPVMTDERFKPSKGLLCVANRDEYAKVLARFCLPQKSNK